MIFPRTFTTPSPILVALCAHFVSEMVDVVSKYIQQCKCALTSVDIVEVKRVLGEVTAIIDENQENLCSDLHNLQINEVKSFFLEHHYAQFVQLLLLHVAPKWLREFTNDEANQLFFKFFQASSSTQDGSAQQTGLLVPPVLVWNSLCSAVASLRDSSTGDLQTQTVQLLSSSSSLATADVMSLLPSSSHFSDSDTVSIVIYLIQKFVNSSQFSALLASVHHTGGHVDSATKLGGLHIITADSFVQSCVTLGERITNLMSSLPLPTTTTTTTTDHSDIENNRNEKESNTFTLPKQTWDKRLCICFLALLLIFTSLESTLPLLCNALCSLCLANLLQGLTSYQPFKHRSQQQLLLQLVNSLERLSEWGVPVIIHTKTTAQYWHLVTSL
jgi:hypothetical protein